MDELISRQAAIDALKNDMASLDHIIKGMSAYDVRLDAYVSQRNQVNCDIYTINNLPPAQPEQLGTNLAEVGTRAVRGYPIDADALMEKVAEEYGERARDTLYRIIRYMPPAQPEPCEDAVSRKDCLQALSHLMDVDGFRDGWAVSRANVECMLKAMPPVTPKQRTGYWYPVGMVEAVGGESAQWGSAVAYHKCSACDEQALRDDFEQEVLSDFCPHCGAKMEGAAE